MSLLESRLQKSRVPGAAADRAGDNTQEPEAQQATALAQAKRLIRERLVEMAHQNLFLGQTGDELRRSVERAIRTIIQENDLQVGRLERDSFVREMLDEVVGYGPLQSLLNDPEITEVMVNGPGPGRVWIERHGRLEVTPLALDRSQIDPIIQRIVAPIDRRVDEASPRVDARLPDGSRVNIVVPPIALDGPYITIRKFRKALTMERLIEFGAIHEDIVRFLQPVVAGRASILVAGGTGSGKTSFLNALASFIPDEERIVTIEDAAELQLQQRHVVRLEARPANLEGKGAVTIRDLVQNALRMRPDRIVVGEVRGGEALDMLQAMNTGHDGSMTTGHANSPEDMISRLETMVMMAGQELPSRAIREQVASAIHLIVFLRRFPDGRRRVVQITEITGMGDKRLEGKVLLTDLFRYDRVQDRLVPTGKRPTRLAEHIGTYGFSVDAFFPGSEAEGDGGGV